jgi:5,10-methylenetetrahydrofolate reductase
MKNMRDKMFDYKHPVIFYELLPPEQHDTVNLDAYIECAVDLLTSTPIMIDAVNIPEIREEDHGVSTRSQNYIPKMDPRVFAKMLEKASYNHIEVILNHCTVYEPLKQQKLWLESISKQHQINLLILVGGNSSKSVYPGPSVVEMGKYIKNHYKNDILCGGITIPSRRYHDQVLDEPFRLYTKGLNGIDFFTTQVIYEPISIKLLLRDYWQICQEKDVQAKRIFLSFAPISTHKDLDFLRWLGVSIPKTVEHELFKANIGIGWRSTKVAVQIFQEILNFMIEEQIQVPLGINIEHITRHNFELSLEFIERLGSLYHHYMGYNQGSQPSRGPK